MSVLFRSTQRQADAGLLIVRAITGLIFMMHGGQKLFVYGFEGVAGGFAQMGIPFASVMGPFVGLLEFFGGIALVLGLLTRPAALGLAATMVVAILQVHLANGFFAPTGYEFALALLGSTIALVIAGAGAYSVDALITNRTGSRSETTAMPAARRAA